MSATPKPTRRTTPKKAVEGAPGSPTSASLWKSKTVKGTLLSVPSGNTALVRRPGMGVFLEQGVIPNGLMPIIQDAMARGEAPKDEDLAPMFEDEEKLKEIMELADAVAVFCCMDPVVAPAPKDDEGNVLPFNHPDRDEDILYVDEVDFNDKMTIFSFAVGGPADLEKFRQEQAADVGTVPER